jgi:hypothetical protein
MRHERGQQSGFGPIAKLREGNQGRREKYKGQKREAGWRID